MPSLTWRKFSCFHHWLPKLRVSLPIPPTLMVDFTMKPLPVDSMVRRGRSRRTRCGTFVFIIPMDRSWIRQKFWNCWKAISQSTTNSHPPLLLWKAVFRDPMIIPTGTSSSTLPSKVNYPTRGRYCRITVRVVMPRRRRKRVRNYPPKDRDLRHCALFFYRHPFREGGEMDTAMMRAWMITWRRICWNRRKWRMRMQRIWVMSMQRIRAISINY
mmetsp:Transcript_463/g.1029  ORF Transcript_463/g.1029 Transcript_463/m.1029 type:complete len:214 (-) Transcript_463:2026-2667(-)